MSEENKEQRSKSTSEVFTISFTTETLPPDEVNANNQLEQPSDFEAAIEATEFGLYNYLLLLAIFPAGWANIFDTTTMSYILPSAECDLQLTLNEKGILNAIIYTGMISAAFLWGFLADTKGRRSLLLYGYLIDSIFNILSSTSQNFYVMLIFKFFCGFVISGPLAISTTYLAEFHSTKYRSATLFWTALFSASGNVALPALAWAIIPQSWSLTLFDGAFVYNSWRIFILVGSMPSLLAALALFHFPESPKYLMTQGRNDEALKVFQKMYAMNTGNPPETFPIKFLSLDVRKKIQPLDGRSSVSFCQKIRGGLSQIKPLFERPYLGQFLLIIILQFGSILSLNTLRLWMPQLFTLMETFDYESRAASLGTPTLCEMISVRNIANVTTAVDLNSTAVMRTCDITVVPSKVYINSMIISSTTVLGFTLAGTLVNLIGKKNLLLLAFAVPAGCIFGLNWSPDSNVTLGIIAVYITLTSISTTAIITFIVDLMPTSLRAMAVGLTMSFGRSGAMIGNVVFPILLSMGCLAPFIFIGGFLIFCFVLTIFIPKPPAKLL